MDVIEAQVGDLVILTVARCGCGENNCIDTLGSGRVIRVRQPGAGRASDAKWPGHEAQNEIVIDFCLPVGLSVWFNDQVKVLS